MFSDRPCFRAVKESIQEVRAAGSKNQRDPRKRERPQKGDQRKAKVARVAGVQKLGAIPGNHEGPEESAGKLETEGSPATTRVRLTWSGSSIGMEDYAWAGSCLLTRENHLPIEC